MLQAITRFLLDHDRFLISSHERPDGDSIGSSLALALGLEAIGKEVEIVHADPAPAPYKNLPGLDRIRVARQATGSFDGLIILECSSPDRTGVSNLDAYFSVSIDHHLNSPPFANLNWLDADAAAVAEMVLVLLDELDAPITEDVATNLYVGILTDTGSFQFSNTRRESFEAAARLVSAGADPGRIARDVYMQQPLSKVLLTKEVMATLELHAEGSVASIIMTKTMLEQTGAKADDTEGLVNMPLSIDGVGLVAFVREQPGNTCRVSLRSKYDIDVAQLAAKHGGGGHAKAAGLALKGDATLARKIIVSELAELLGSPLGRSSDH